MCTVVILVTASMREAACLSRCVILFICHRRASMVEAVPHLWGVGQHTNEADG